MQIIIIRHADPNYAIDDLTEQGHLEAAALGKYLKDQELDELYVSPLGRAQTTATYVAKETGLPMRTENWTQELAEWSVDLPNGEKIAAWDYPGELMESRKNDLVEWRKEEDLWLREADKKEKYEQLVTDSDHFLESFGLVRQGGIYEMRDPSKARKKIAVVCHAGFGLAWLAHLLYIPLSHAWQAMWLAPSSMTTVLFDQRNTNRVVPRCLHLNEVTHLYAAGLPVQPHGLLATNYK